MNDEVIGLELQVALWAMSEYLLFKATSPWELDDAMVDFGFSLGSCQAQDIAGLDVVLAGNRQLAGREITPVLPRMVDDGRLGRNVSVGWYRYPGGGGLVIDPLVEDLLREEARFARIARRDMSNEEIIDHLALALINVSADILGRADAPTIGQINRVSISRLGFPAQTGGVLKYAAETGINATLRRLKRLTGEASMRAMRISNHLDLLRRQV